MKQVKTNTTAPFLPSPSTLNYPSQLTQQHAAVLVGHCNGHLPYLSLSLSTLCGKRLYFHLQTVGCEVENIPTTGKQGRIVIFAYTCFMTDNHLKTFADNTVYMTFNKSKLGDK
jgi:hypothetical protein